MKKKNQWVISNIKRAGQLGLEICVDGREYTYTDIRKSRYSIIKEKADYMSDYIYDEQGKVIGIHFNKI